MKKPVSMPDQFYLTPELFHSDLLFYLIFLHYIHAIFLFLALLLDFAIQTKQIHIHYNESLHHYYCSYLYV